MRALRVVRRAPEPEEQPAPEAGSDGAPVPALARAWEPELIRGEAGNQDRDRLAGGGGSGPEPEPAGSGPAGSVAPPVPGPVATWARATARAGCEAAGRAASRRVTTAGTLPHTVWQYRPRSVAEHDDHARSRAWVPAALDKDGRFGRAGEFQLHTAGRILKLAGNGLSALGDSVPGQWAVLIVLVLTGLAVRYLVLLPAVGATKGERKGKCTALLRWRPASVRCC